MNKTFVWITTLILLTGLMAKAQNQSSHGEALEQDLLKTLPQKSAPTQIVSHNQNLSAKALNPSILSTDFNPVRFHMENLSDTTHLEFSGRDAWNYKIQRTKTTVEMELDKMDQASLDKIKSIKTPFVSKVDVLEGANNQIKVIFHLNKVSKTEVKSFDYITDEPSRLVVDFYRETAPVVKEDPLSKNQVKNKKSLKNSIVKTKKGSSTRAPAGVDFFVQEKTLDEQIQPANLDGADPNYLRFEIPDSQIKESAVIASKLNLYIPFPLMSVPFVELQKIIENPTDYEIPKNNNDENKKARLLVTLFNKGKKDLKNPLRPVTSKPRPAVFLKALELFRKEYPKSSYKEVLDFMEADTYFFLWEKDKKDIDFETAMALYTKILGTVHSSKYHNRTLKLIAYAYLEKEDYLNAYTYLGRLLKQAQDPSEKYQTQIAMAEALIGLNKTDDALKIFDEIVRDPNSGKFRVIATVRSADVFAKNKEFDKAIPQYESALKEYSQYKYDFPNVRYNLAESQFWFKRDIPTLKESLGNYITFLKEFPKNEHSSFAMERIGEILEILGADQKQYEGALQETVYRYGNSVAANVAKIRLLKSHFGEKKEKDLKFELNAIDKFIKNSDIAGIHEFQTLMVSDGYKRKKDYDNAFNLLVAFLQEKPLSPHADLFKKQIAKVLAEQMFDDIANQDYLKAFQTYGKNAEVWLRKSNRLDVEYALGISYEKLGVPDSAIQKYKEVLSELTKIKNTEADREKRVNENLPNLDEINLRLAFNYSQKNDYGKALESLKSIQEKNLSNNERVEKTYISSIVYEKLNNTQYAIQNLKDLTESWKGKPELLAPIYTRLAKLQFENNDKKQALVNLDKAYQSSQESETDLSKMEVLKLKAEFAQKMNNIEEAQEAYRKLLDQFENKYPLYSSRYQLGKIYFDRGEIKEAEKVWNPLQDKSDATLWSKLAQENLNNAQWNSDYKKYTNRIPAMARDEDKKGGDKK